MRILGGVSFDFIKERRYKRTQKQKGRGESLRERRELPSGSSGKEEPKKEFREERKNRGRVREEEGTALLQNNKKNGKALFRNRKTEERGRPPNY